MGGDTLYDISKRYRLSMRDIAYLNKLNAPFMLAEGQRLRLPPPQEYKVRSGDTLYEISRMFSTDTSAVARQNNLSAPYTIRTGQVLRMPSSVPAPKPKRAATTRLANVSPPQKPSAGNAARPAKTNAKANAPAAREPVSRPVKISSTPPSRAASKFLKPVEGRVISGYGPKKDGLHNDGINIAAARGTPVKAAENGVVVYVGNELKGSGNLILVRHADRYMSAYAHLDQFLIKRGQTVQRGQSIGTVGSTGAVSAPQLHFEIRRGTEAINPQGYLGN
jgi:murein DD-endopeptidase MepM/ murein hydrolase activator NlpD